MIPCFHRVKQARSNERALNVMWRQFMLCPERKLGQDVGGLVMQTNVVSLWSPLGIDIACMVSVAAFERKLGQAW